MKQPLPLRTHGLHLTIQPTGCPQVLRELGVEVPRLKKNGAKTDLRWLQAVSKGTKRPRNALTPPHLSPRDQAILPSPVHFL